MRFIALSVIPPPLRHLPALSSVIPAEAGIQGEWQMSERVALLEWTAPNGIDVPE